MSTLISVSSLNCPAHKVANLTHLDMPSLISSDHLHGLGVHWEQAVAHQLHSVGLVARDHFHLHHLLDRPTGTTTSAYHWAARHGRLLGVAGRDWIAIHRWCGWKSVAWYCWNCFDLLVFGFILDELRSYLL